MRNNKSIVDIPISDKGNGINGSRVMDVFEDDSDYLYFAVDQGGINRLNKQSMKFEYFDGEKNGLLSNGIYCFYEDNNGMIWVGTSRAGVFYYSPTSPNFYSYKRSYYQNTTTQKAYNNLAGNIIGCFHEDAKGNIWIGTDGDGISIFNTYNETFLNIKNEDENDNLLPSNVIRSIVSDANNNIWLATWQSGISIYNQKQKSFTPWPNKKDSLFNRIPLNIWSLFIDSNNNLWMSFEDGKIMRYNLVTCILDEYSYKLSDDIHALPYFYEFNRGQILITNSSGVFEINETNKNIETILNIDEVTSLAIDVKNNYWIGTSNNGVLVYNEKLEKTKHFNSNNSLKDDNVSSIILGNDSNIWISTSNGLYGYLNEEDVLLSYFKSDGLQGNQFFLQSGYKTTNGDIYFGGTEGFTYFTPSKIRINNEKPRVIINSILVDNVPFSQKQKDKNTKIHPRYFQNLELPYNHSVLNIKFNALNF